MSNSDTDGFIVLAGKIFIAPFLLFAGMILWLLRLVFRTGKNEYVRRKEASSGVVSIYSGSAMQGGQQVGFVRAGHVYSGFGSSAKEVGYIEGSEVFGKRGESDRVGHIDGSRIFRGTQEVGHVDGKHIYSGSRGSSARQVGYSDTVAVESVGAAALLLLLG